MPVLETRRPRSGLAGSALNIGRTTRSEPLDRTPGMSSRTSPAARRARSSKSGRNPRGPPVGAGAQDDSWGAGDSSSAPQDAGPQPARNRPLSICKWSGRTPTQKPRGRPGGQALQALHRMERSILITEGFTERQTEHRLRTVVGAKMGPRPVCGPLRPLCARPSPPGPGSARGPVSVPFLRCTRSWSRRGGSAGADPPRSPRGSLSLPSDLVQGACPEQPVGPGWGDVKGPPCPLPDPVSSSKGQRRTVVNPARAGGPRTCSPARKSTTAPPNADELSRPMSWPTQGLALGISKGTRHFLLAPAQGVSVCVLGPSHRCC